MNSRVRERVTSEMGIRCWDEVGRGAAGRVWVDVGFEVGDWRTVDDEWCGEDGKSGWEKAESQHFASCLDD